VLPSQHSSSSRQATAAAEPTEHPWQATAAAAENTIISNLSHIYNSISSTFIPEVWDIGNYK